MANAVVNNGFNLDKRPVFVQLLIGIIALLIIAVVGFSLFFAVDILLLDFDPIGKVISAIASAARG